MAEHTEAATPRQIVVAGSAGKSSTATMIASLIQAAGGHVVQFDGHYLHSPLERVKVDGQALDAEAARALLAGRADTGQAGAVPVEALLQLSLERSGASWLVVSGAALPASPLVEVVFAPILPDVQTGAGDVARAIIHDLQSSPIAVTALQRESALDILRPAFPGLMEVAARCRLSRGRADLDGQEFRLKTDLAEYRLHLPLLGAFQVENAVTAILAVEQLRSFGVELEPGQARVALDAVRLPGRMEVIKRRPLIIVDTGAAGQAFRRIADAVHEIVAGRRLRIVLDLSGGLDPAIAVPALAPLSPDIVTVGAGPDMSALRHACGDAGIAVQTAPGVEAAVDQALDATEQGESIAVLGSTAAAAAARALILGLLPADLRLNYTEP
jgi:dihydrofolate synthase/folylpolyglutamate synthase